MLPLERGRIQMNTKICTSCNKENDLNSAFCIHCGNNEFRVNVAKEASGETIPPAQQIQAPQTPPPQAPTPMAPPPVQPVINQARPNPMPAQGNFIPQPIPYAGFQKQKVPFTQFDLFSILGFVASLVGMFCAALLLHPLGAVSSFYGFRKGTKLKGLAAAGFVISIVGGIVYAIISLYDAGIIPEWLADGAFH